MSATEATLGWLEVAARIVPGGPETLDDLPGMDDLPAARRGGWLARQFPPQAALPHAHCLWPLRDAGRACIGVRVTAALADTAGVAAHLVAMAAERAITPIILSQLSPSGFERYGFRVERLAGANEAERAACEAELTSLWDIALIIDAADIASYC